jgi:hypothetical protein
MLSFCIHRGLHSVETAPKRNTTDLHRMQARQRTQKDRRRTKHPRQNPVPPGFGVGPKIGASKLPIVKLLITNRFP